MSKYSIPIDRAVRREAKQALNTTHRSVQSLTPAGKQMLIRLLNTYNANDGKALNRRQIAAVLGRPSDNLTPHDRTLLKRLCNLGLLTCKRRTLWTADHMARGAEFRYTMNADTAWLLNTIRRRNRRK